MPHVTFEEVYANAYVRKSINALMDKLICDYPWLRSDRDDIRQTLLLILNRQLSSYDPKKSSLERFARITLESGICEVRRAYFTKKARQKEQFFNCALSVELADEAETRDRSVELRETVEAVRYVMEQLPPVQQTICAMLIDGESFMSICRELKMDFDTLKYKHVAEIRKMMQKNIF